MDVVNTGLERELNGVALTALAFSALTWLFLRDHRLFHIENFGHSIAKFRSGHPFAGIELGDKKMDRL